MGYLTRIRFTGLCGFVPSENDLALKQKDWAGVFLPNATTPEDALEDIEKQLTPHYPFVVFNHADLDASGPAVAKGLWPLANDDVVIVANSTANELRTDFKRINKEVPESSDEEKLFDWVQPIETMMMGTGKVSPDCFKASLTNRLVARIHLNRGTLRTERIGKFNKAPVVMLLGDSGQRRAVAVSVVLEMEGVTGKVMLRARRIDAVDVRDLTFKEKGNGETLTIDIVNLCADYLLESTVLGRQPFSGVEPFPDLDYRWNYRLSEGTTNKFIAKALVPTPVRFLRNAGGGGGEPARCSPPRYQAALTDEVNAMKAIVKAITEA